MSKESPDERLTNFRTRWSLLDAARGLGTQARQARSELVEHYYFVVLRFLERRLPRDPQAVLEVMGTFCEAMLDEKGILFKADRNAGKFRHFLKRILTNKITDYYRRKQPQTSPGEEELPADTGNEDDESLNTQFTEELFNRAWRRLQEHERASEQPFYTVCRIQYENPQLRAPEKAAIASEKLGRKITPENFRKIVERGSQKLADLIIDEVVRDQQAFTDGPIPPALVEEDLRELGLFSFCEKALQRYAERVGD